MSHLCKDLGKLGTVHMLNSESEDSFLNLSVESLKYELKKSLWLDGNSRLGLQFDLQMLSGCWSLLTILKFWGVVSVLFACLF